MTFLHWAGGLCKDTGTTNIKNISIYGIRTDGNIENSGLITFENLGTDFEVYIYTGCCKHSYLWYGKKYDS